MPSAPTPGRWTGTRCQMPLDLRCRARRVGDKGGSGSCAYEGARVARVNRNRCLGREFKGTDDADATA